jgi:hypothetical protein
MWKIIGTIQPVQSSIICTNELPEAEVTRYFNKQRSMESVHGNEPGFVDENDSSDGLESYIGGKYHASVERKLELARKGRREVRE